MYITHDIKKYLKPILFYIMEFFIIFGFSNRRMAKSNNSEIINYWKAYSTLKICLISYLNKNIQIYRFKLKMFLTLNSK